VTLAMIERHYTHIYTERTILLKDQKFCWVQNWK